MENKKSNKKIWVIVLVAVLIVIGALGTMAKIERDKRIEQERIQAVLEEKREKEQERKEYIDEQVKSVKDELGNDAVVTYDEKKNVIKIEAKGEFKEGLSYVNMWPSDKEMMKSWNELIEYLKADTKFGSNFGAENMEIRLIDPRNPNKAFLSVKNGVVLEDALRDVQKKK